MFIFLALGVHAMVVGVKWVSRFLHSSTAGKTHPKVRTIVSLVSSVLVFTLYFGTIGLVLRELGVSLTAYLASASVIGLAVGFGSQGLVQDVVTGVTLIASDLLDIGDMVELGGQTGLVRSVGIRFTVLTNAMGAEVFIPNRTIGNVLNYPKGYVRCIVDVTLPPNSKKNQQALAVVQSLASSFMEQFPAIFRKPPTILDPLTIGTRNIIRTTFRIWPGRGGPIEIFFKQSLFQSLLELDNSFAEWMIAVYYEIRE